MVTEGLWAGVGHWAPRGPFRMNQFRIRETWAWSVRALVLEKAEKVNSGPTTNFRISKAKGSMLSDVVPQRKNSSRVPRVYVPGGSVGCELTNIRQVSSLLQTSAWSLRTWR